MRTTSKWKIFPLLLLAATLAGETLLAQQPVFIVKFVCGFEQGNVPFLFNPNPLPLPYEDLKPGNYATVINFFNFGNQQENIVSLAFAEGLNTGLPPGLLSPPFTTNSLDCTDITAALNVVNGGILVGQSIEGYLMLVPLTANLKVTAVYTFESQNGFERHVVWTAAGGQLEIVTEVLNKTIGTICGPIIFDQFFEVLDLLAASGAGGLGLGASIDVEEIDVTLLPPPGAPAAFLDPQAPSEGGNR